MHQVPLQSNSLKENNLTLNEHGTFPANATKIFNNLPVAIYAELCQAKFLSVH